MVNYNFYAQFIVPGIISLIYFIHERFSMYKMYSINNDIIQNLACVNIIQDST